MEQILFYAMIGSIVVVGVAICVYALRQFGKLNRRMSLVIKALYRVTKDQRSHDGKLDRITNIGHQAFEFQRKTFDHHRIMVSSLKNQVRNIEDMMGENAAPRSRYVPNKSNHVREKTAAIPKPAHFYPISNLLNRGSVLSDHTSENSVLLEELFNKRKENAAPRPRDMPAPVPASEHRNVQITPLHLFEERKPELDPNAGERRVANG